MSGSRARATCCQFQRRSLKTDDPASFQSSIGKGDGLSDLAYPVYAPMAASSLALFAASVKQPGRRAECHRFPPRRTPDYATSSRTGQGEQPTLLSAQQNLLSMKAQEVEAGLRQNPYFAVSGSNVSISTQVLRAYILLVFSFPAI